MSDTFLAEFIRLSTAQQVQLVEDLWCLIFAKGDGPALTEPQRALLDRELEEIADHPSDGTTLAELKERLVAGSK